MMPALFTVRTAEARMMRWSRWGVGVAILVGVLANPAMAQQKADPGQRSAYVPLEFMRAGRVAMPGVLAKRVTVQRTDVVLQQVLMDIANQAGLGLSYGEDLVRSATVVSLDVSRISAADALAAAVKGTKWTVLVTMHGQVTVVEERSVARAAGTVMGHVAERGSNAPVVAARVTIGGTRLIQYTDDKGNYRIAGVPVGEQEIAVRRLGFEPTLQKVRVADGETITMDVVMGRLPTALNQVVTTAAGERSRLEVGNSIGTINADSLVPANLIRNVTDLLQARTPGVLVTNGSGAIGSTSKIRIRGASSLQLNNDPIIVLDGVRLNWLNTPSGSVSGVSSQTNTGLGMALGTAKLGGRIDDIDPNTIESIDVLRGPSAATLYGTEAANGVIVIKTKKGGVGTWRLNLLADNGWSNYGGAYPAQWRAWGSTSTGTLTTTCTPLYSGDGRGGSLGSGVPCHVDSISAFNGQNDPNLTGLGTGTARNASVNLSGGSPQLQEFLSLRGSDQVGMIRLSNVEQRRIQQMWGTPAPSWMVRPNAEQDWDASSRTTVRINTALDLQLGVHGIYRNLRSNADGISSGATYLGPWDTLSVLPAENMRNNSTGLIKRGFGSASANYIPASWVTLTANLGGDYTLRSDNLLQPASACTVALAPATGCVSSHTNDRGETFVTTANVGAQLSFAPRSWLGLRTAIGEQYSGTKFYELNAASSFSANLAFGTDLLTPAPVATSGTPQLYTVTENRDQSASAGYYIEQTMSVHERLFLTLALRQDAASAFGSTVNLKLPTYPKYSLSWLASDEAFFPFKTVISSFRLRAAYGHSGNQARQTDVLPNYTTGTTLVDASATPLPGAILAQIPNPALKPERTTEAEGGIDLSLFDNERIHVEATLYRKLSQDAITNVTLPLSYGAVNTTQRVNLGAVENRGTELSVAMKLIESRAFGWDMAVNYTDNHNKLVKVNVLSIQIRNQGGAELMWGYPLYGYWQPKPASYNDLNGDGILQANEIAWSSGTPGVPLKATGGFVYLGPPYPKSEVTYNNSITLLSGAIRINAVFDQVNDLLAVGSNSGDKCTFAPAECTLPQQALAVFGMYASNIRDMVSYLRFSELSATFNLPRSSARLFHAQSAAVTFAGRNLALWSDYVWKDPAVQNVSDATAGGVGTNGYGQPQNWTIRFNLGF